MNPLISLSVMDHGKVMTTYECCVYNNNRARRLTLVITDILYQQRDWFVL